MGPPVKVVLNGEPVFLCCQGCVQSAKANPEATIARVKQQGAENKSKAPAASQEGAR
jgi:hypothetical protein